MSSYSSPIEKSYNKMFLAQQRIIMAQQEIISAKEEIILAQQEISSAKTHSNTVQTTTNEGFVGSTLGGTSTVSNSNESFTSVTALGSGVGSICGGKLRSYIDVMHQSENEAEAVQATWLFLDSIFGKQHAFYVSNQATLILNVVGLLNRLHVDGNSSVLSDFIEVLSNRDLLMEKVCQLKALEGNSDLVLFFENEFFVHQDFYQSIMVGVRTALNKVVPSVKGGKING